MAEFISSLADVGAIWLITLSLVVCLIPLSLVGGMVFGMYKLLRALPPLLKRGQEGMVRVADGAEKASIKVAEPFVAASAAGSQLKGMARNIGKIWRRK